jgi:hypothetical protein
MTDDVAGEQSEKRELRQNRCRGRQKDSKMTLMVKQACPQHGLDREPVVELSSQCEEYTSFHSDGNGAGSGQRGYGSTGPSPVTQDTVVPVPRTGKFALNSFFWSVCIRVRRARCTPRSRCPMRRTGVGLCPALVTIHREINPSDSPAWRIAAHPCAPELDGSRGGVWSVVNIWLGLTV